MTSKVINTPISDKIVRERMFEITGDREDKKDIHAIVVLTLKQLMDAKTTGQVVLNFNQGHIANMVLKETRRP